MKSLWNLKRLAFACSVAVAAAATSLSAWSLQIVDVSDGRSHLVDISKKEMSRLAVESGKIRRLDFIDGELETKKDDQGGDYYLLPLVSKPINVFVKTTSGQTHALILQPKDIPLESIILKEPVSRDAKRTGPIERAGSLEVAVKRLVLAMARGEKPMEFDVTTVNQEIGLWNEARFVLTERYVGRTLVGERYRLTNTSNAVMRLAEQELYKKGVVAISIEAQVLNPGETTEVFIAKVNNDG
jgi:conjugal transfer pilus assembly protein TraK